MFSRIESLDDPRLDPYRDLKVTNQTRYSGWFIAEGRHVVLRLIESDYEIVSILLAEHAIEEIRPQLPQRTNVLVLPDDQVDRLVGFKFHAGVIACGKRFKRSSLAELPQLSTDERLTLVACPHIILPDNLGSIIRICSAFGAHGLLVGEKSADPFSRRTIRVSMGNIFRLPIVEPPRLADMLIELRDQHEFCLVAATGKLDAEHLPIPRPAARMVLIMGHEAHGLEEDMLSLCERRVTIPMSGKTDSLNVATAAAVLLYQFTRVGVEK